ncbi:HEAT repeat domain-containing protein [Synechococcus sp. RSCCF101]|uniref:HEAT repeat domain-containing protein n=1 Tax=Synechococcus sp. RSCCF101 TaxID=2511069 RepID=UPI001CD9A721|nr:HEAT repeat domain-containing protein [Synechococcus sp. RSCCF101]
MSTGEPIDEQEALARLRQTEDTSAQYYAAWWVGRMRSRHPEVIPLLIRALAQRQPRQPDSGVEANAVARNAARSLGKLRAAQAVPELLQVLEDPDYGLREAAARALGDIGDARALPGLCRRLEGGVTGAGAPAAGTPFLQEPCEALLEALGDIGVADQAVLDAVQPFEKHERPIIRSAAWRALLILTGESRWAGKLLELLQDGSLQVRRAALMDLGAVGWRNSLEPIQRTQAENSLKLIALRGLAEHPRGEGPDLERVLEAMDALL